MVMIQLQGIGLAFPYKTCFSDFDATIMWGQHIAIVGDNGSGKSSLLKILHGSLLPSAGDVVAVCSNLNVGYMAQEPFSLYALSGGQRINQALSHVFAQSPDVLLLDEPTNHLDAKNQRSLCRQLQCFPGSLVLATHDEALIDQVCDTIWYISQEQITVFFGRYADYLSERDGQRNAIKKQLVALKQAQQQTHEALMQEQQRASHARQRGAKSIREHKWATLTSPTKLGRGTTTSGRKQAEIREKRGMLKQKLAQIDAINVIEPRFYFPSTVMSTRPVLHIVDGAAGYEAPLLQTIHLTLGHGDRVALLGDNGSGKSTLARAIYRDTWLRQGGDWQTPSEHAINYLDQHYANIDPRHTVLQAITHIVPDWPYRNVRHHLSDFLFRDNDAVHTRVTDLSGGEIARLAFACIAAKPPKLLILDEPTNHLDRRTRQHVIEILRDYPGTMLLITHDDDFLQQLGPVQRYRLTFPLSKRRINDNVPLNSRLATLVQE